MKCLIRNWVGEKVTNPYVVRDRSFLMTDEKGRIKINWSGPRADSDGFDKEHREPNGRPRMLVELPVGTELLRYGAPGGSFTAPKGTDYEQLSLPYEKSSMEYNEYRVIAHGVLVEVCTAERGRVAPLFNQPGGGIQYYHGDDSVQDLLDAKKLKRIELWQD